MSKKIFGNIAIVDCNLANNKLWKQFVETIEEKNNIVLNVIDIKKNIKKVKLHSLTTYINWFYNSFRLFINRKKINNIISIQQFYGIIFAFFCKLFKTQKSVNVIIVTFIYKKKSGFIGKIYYKFIKYIVCSDYIDILCVHSSNEVLYYKKMFDISDDKIVYIPLGITDESENFMIRNDNFILSIGNSNRDYLFVEECLKNYRIPTKIYTSMRQPHTNGNVSFYDSVSTSEYFELLSKCSCVVIALENPDISSGQLVLLQAYSFGKPVIITKSKCCEDYVGEFCIVIEKNEKELIEKIDKLFNDDDYYNEISRLEKKVFNKKFVVDQMANNISNYFVK